MVLPTTSSDAGIPDEIINSLKEEYPFIFFMMKISSILSVWSANIYDKMLSSPCQFHSSKKNHPHQKELNCFINPLWIIEWKKSNQDI